MTADIRNNSLFFSWDLGSFFFFAFHGIQNNDKRTEKNEFLSKMQVNYAVQMLSHSVANGFRYFRSMPETQDSFQGSMLFTNTFIITMVFIALFSN
jgi:hypothetical protein